MFDSESITALQRAIGITEANAAITQQIDGGIVALPDNYNQHDLEPYMVYRRRARGVMITSALADFAAYAKSHAEEGATVFVDSNEMSATAVLNLGLPAQPGHADNRAKLQLKTTAAYAALRNHASGKPLNQLQAAEFLEDWAGSIKCFTNEAEVAPPKAIAAIRKLSIESMRKLESSEQSLSASRSAFESVQATSAEPIPTTIYFDCVPYHGLERRQFVLRLGVLTGGDKPAVTLRIVQEELHGEEMAIEFAHLTRDALGGAMPVLVGAYSKTA